MMKFVVLCGLIATALAAPSTQENQGSLLEEVYDIYSSCSGKDLSVCLKMKALGYVDRAARSAEINLMDGIKIVKVEEESKASRADNARSLNDIEANLPVEIEAKEAAVDDAILEKTIAFMSTHTVEVNKPGARESRAANDEARLLKKKKGLLKHILPLMMILKLKALFLIPVVIGVLTLMVFKALIAGKIALVLSAILAFQKFVGANRLNTYDQLPVPINEAHTGGWARAYAGQKPTQ